MSKSLDLSNTILLFTDGACSGNPGPGGWGTILAFPDGQIEELGDFNPNTTNNRMEMASVIRGLQKAKNCYGDLWVLTDSTYVIRGITQWIWGWKKRGWLTAEGKDVTNKDLWLALADEVAQRKKMGNIEWKYLRGHQGTPGNERCDEIAVAFSKRKNIHLYSGPLLEYPIAIHDLPDNLEMPAIKPRTEKVSAHSYLSYVNGVLERHDSWPACEARVKGRSGAKFKKAKSQQDEIDIAMSWGADPSKLDD